MNKLFYKTGLCFDVLPKSSLGNFYLNYIIFSFYPKGIIQQTNETHLQNENSNLSNTINKKSSQTIN